MMNKMALMLAGICLCGATFAQDAASAISVDGSNTAVVIKKTAVSSTTGYQLLVVPVKGLDIATGDGTGKHITLDAMLPHGTYGAATVQVVSLPESASGEALTAVGRLYTAAEEGWTYSAGDGTASSVSGNNDEFPAGTIFWLKDNGGTSQVEGLQTLAAGDAVVFCGSVNDGTVTWSNVPSGSVVALGNSSSDTITVGTLTEASEGDQLFRINSGSSEYTIYQFLRTRQSPDAPMWVKLVNDKNGNTSYDMNAASDTIPAAEAFYIYNKN